MDISYSKTLHFKIKAERGQFTLSARVNVHQVFISNRSASDSTVPIVEDTHTTISDIKAECRGKVLDSKWISFHYPQSQDMFIEPGRIHEIAFPDDLRPPEAISYSYSQSFEDLAFFPLIEIPAMNKVDRLEVIVDHPADFLVDFSVFHAHAILNPIVDRSDSIQTRLVFENLPEPQMLPSDPFRWMHACILPKITRAGQPMNPHTPEAFTKWYLGLLEPTSTSSDSMRNLLSKELAIAGSRKEKARILFDYVKTQIRYIADEGSGHAFLPHASSEVMEKKWGDCKDKARLLTVLARIHDIPLFLALLNTKPSPEFPEVNLGLFNHVICVLEDGEELYFMDPTAYSSELGDPPDSDLLAKALVMNPRNPRYVVVPSQKTAPDLDLFLDGDWSGLNEGDARFVMRHSWRIRTLQARRELNDKDFETYLVKQCDRVFAKLTFTGFRLVEDNPEFLTIKAKVDMSDYFILSGSRIYAPVAPFRVVDREMLEREGDSYTVNAYGPDHYRFELNLLVQGFHPKPEQIAIGEAVSPSYTAFISGSTGKAKMTYSFQQPFRVVPAASRSRFFVFCNDYLKLNRQLFLLQRSIP